MEEKITLISLENLGEFKTQLVSYIDAADAKALKTVAIDGNVLKFYTVAEPVGETAPAYEIELPETDLTAINAAISTLNTNVATNTSAIEKLNGDETTDGSVAKAVKDSADAIDAKIGTLGNLTTTAKTDLVNAINEVRAAVDVGGTGSQVTIDTSNTTEGYLKSYTIKQGENTIGTIDIPKDLVVTGGEIVVDPEGQEEGTYIKLTIANQTAPLYINVADLVDAYTAQASATQIQLAISDANEISATIVAGSVGTTELTDAGVTAAKLANDAKALFDKETYANVANTIGLTANKILQGNTILGIAGTGKTESDVLNFPLSIQDAQPTPIRNGHIWIKSSTLASQITSATIQESLNAGAANNSLQFVVGESATSYLWLQNRDKKLTSGGNYVSTQIVANNGGSQDWTVSVIGNIMEYKLNRPMVYSKVNNVLDIETAYMWNGSSWVMLGEKGNYAIAVGAGDTHVRVFNRINNSFNLSQQFQSSSSSMVNEDIALPSSFSSRDGRVFLISRARVYKVYYRTGDVYTNILDIPYNKNLTLNGVTYTGVAINAVPSGNGNYIFVWYRGVPATSGSQHFSQIVVYSFNGSTYTITQESAVYQLAGTPTNTICRQLTVNNEGTACAILYMNNGGFLDVFFRDSKDEETKQFYYEYEVCDNPYVENPPTAKTSTKPYVENPHVASPHVEFPHGSLPIQWETHLYNKTLSNNTINNNTLYTNIIQINIDYNPVFVDSSDKELVDNIIDIMVDIFVNNYECIKINHGEINSEHLKIILLKVNMNHIIYTIDAINNYKNKITNMRNFILSVLYNSVLTLDTHYQNLVSM